MNQRKLCSLETEIGRQIDRERRLEKINAAKAEIDGSFSMAISSINVDRFDWLEKLGDTRTIRSWRDINNRSDEKEIRRFRSPYGQPKF